MLRLLLARGRRYSSAGRGLSIFVVTLVSMTGTFYLTKTAWFMTLRTREFIIAHIYGILTLYN